MKQISNKNLLNSTESYSQNLIIIYKRNWKRIHTHTHTHTRVTTLPHTWNCHTIEDHQYFYWKTKEDWRGPWGGWPLQSCCGKIRVPRTSYLLSFPRCQTMGFLSRSGSEEPVQASAYSYEALGKRQRQIRSRRKTWKRGQRSPLRCLP